MTFPHWDYFLAIDRDLDVLSRYIDFVDANMAVYSTELTKLYLSVCSEIDVVARQLTKKIDQTAKTRSIDDYRRRISPRYPYFLRFPVAVRRYGSSLVPWESWSADKNPSWWQSYNKVKHHRHQFFHEANLRNVLNAACGLFVLVFYFYQEAFYSGSIPL